MEIDDSKVCWLSARITPGDAKCDQYRRSKSQSCLVCEIYVPARRDSIDEEGEDMGSKVKCNVKGCEKLSKGSKFGDMCKAHHSGNKPRPARSAGVLKAIPMNTPVIELSPVIEAGEPEKPIALDTPMLSEAVCVEMDYPLSVVNSMIKELEVTACQKVQLFADDLRGATSEYTRAKLFVHMMDSIEGMVY